MFVGRDRDLQVMRDYLLTVSIINLFEIFIVHYLAQ